MAFFTLYCCLLYVFGLNKVSRSTAAFTISVLASIVITLGILLTALS